MFHQCKVCNKITFAIFFATWWIKPNRDEWGRKLWGKYRTNVCKRCVRQVRTKNADTAEEILLNQYHIGKYN